MAVRSIPAAVSASLGGQSYGQANYNIFERSEPTGDTSVRVLGPSRWLSSLRSKQAIDLAGAGEWEALICKLHGSIDHLAVWDHLRPLPQGTLRGAPTLAASRSIGNSSLTLAKVRSEANLLTADQAFDNTEWTLSNASVTPNTHARANGSAVTADTLTDASASSGFVEQAVTVADDTAQYTGSVYVRKTTGGTSPTFALELLLQNGTPVSANVRVNTDTGAVVSSGGTSTSSGDGLYWRISIGITNNASGNTNLRFLLYPARAPHNSSVADPAQTGSAVVWGAQLEAGAVMTAFLVDKTLRRGDWLQIGTGVGTSQLVKVVDNATASAEGTMAVNFEPPLRYAFSAGAAVTLDKPLGYYKMTNERSTWQARPGGPAMDGFALDLIEDWRP